MIEAKEFIRAINNPIRKKIIALLETNPGLSVTQIYVKLRIEQSLASSSLSILRKADIVYSEKDGKKRRYSVYYGAVKRKIDYLEQFKYIK